MEEPQVILVNEKDQVLGTMPKMEAHLKGELHRAISVFIFDMDGNWLLQKRAPYKYHSANLWTNTCCSHPYPNETSIDAANRRLLEEMGLECELNFAFKYLYKAELDNNLIEHELDHVFIGFTNQIPLPDSEEVSEWKTASFFDIDQDIELYPERYTEWFKLLYKKVNLHLVLETTFRKN
ncbi:MAG: isopentenyl-diphosphate Delta-isomerase [Flavobacteriales bacterium]|nr:isopentenyl-diphosphate Delta-isomerase [Flavobacteriales bacterium]